MCSNKDSDEYKVSYVVAMLVAYLEEHAFISMDRSAYLKGHSTQTSLHRVNDDWLENINEKLFSTPNQLVCYF